MLTRVEVHGFKSIKEMDLELYPLNVLIGANGAGKSNFISLFHLLNRIYENKLQLFVAQSGGPDPLLYFGQKVTQELFVKLVFGDNMYRFTLVPSFPASLVFSDEICYYWNRQCHNKPYDESLGTGHAETNLSKAKATSGVARHVLDHIQSWKIYHFHDTGGSARIKQPANIHDNFMLRPDASNLAAFLYFLKQRYPQHYQNIVDTVRLAAPFFDDFNLRPNPLNQEIILLEWKEKDSDDYFNVHYFSDGTLRFICLATLLLQPILPPLILIDEPELGLHPYAITLLAGLLRSAAKTTQVIVATQSVTLVNQLEPKEVIVVDKHEKQSVFRHLDKEDMAGWIEEYGLGDLWEKNIFGGRP
jgi:predicted ATPase